MKKLLLTLIILFSFNQFGYANPVKLAYNDFNIGNYYYMLADGVRIRSQPNLNGEIVGRLSLHSRIKIISSVGYESFQIIDDVSAYWYLIEFENITGYIWGGYIAANTLIYDIDNNGIDDYFHYRVSRIIDPHFYQVDSWKDVVIYINNKKITTTNIVSKNWRGDTNHIWGEVYFKPTENNTVLISMYWGTPGYTLQDKFEIDKLGNISHLERIEDTNEVDY